MPADHLTSHEHAALGNLGTAVDCRRVRLYRTASGFSGLVRRVVLGASRNRAIALGNHVFIPDRCRDDLAVLAHELTHCGQYQAWGPARYYLRGLTTQVRDLFHRTTRIGCSQYQYRGEPPKAFEAYGMEQQSQIVEDCFRGDAVARTISPFHPAREP
jgi:hypothetical protein